MLRQNPINVSFGKAIDLEWFGGARRLGGRIVLLKLLQERNT